MKTTKNRYFNRSPPLFFDDLCLDWMKSMLQPASTLPSEGVAIYFLTPKAYKKAKKRVGGNVKRRKTAPKPHKCIL